MKTEFDKIIASKLASEDYPVDQSVWKAVEGSLDAPSAPSSGVSFHTPLAAGVVATIGLAGLLNVLPNASTNDHAIEANATVTHVETEVISSQAEGVISAVDFRPQQAHEIVLSDEVEATQVAQTETSRSEESSSEIRTSVPSTKGPGAMIDETEETSDQIQLAFTAVGIQCPGSVVVFTSSSEDIKDQYWLIDGVHVLEGHSASFAFDEPGIHEVILMATIDGESVSTRKTIEIFEQPIAAMNYQVQSSSSCFEQPVTLIAEPSTNRYAWSVAGQTAQGPEGTVALKTGRYNAELSIINEAGCTSAEKMLVIVEGGLELFIPNSFTPNGDAKNDAWSVVGLDQCAEHSIEIFRVQDNVKVFETTQGDSWDGTLMESSERANRGDKFIYRIVAQDNCGATKEFKGTITSL